MGKFFVFAAAVSVIWGVFSGRTAEVSAAALQESSHAVELTVKLLGSLCFWSGIMEVARQSGLVDMLCSLLSPLLKLIFPSLKTEKEAMGLVSMNVAANLLGLGNAATPLGIAVMKKLHALSGFSAAATKEMVCFVVMNTASLQILPTTIAVLRLEAGAEKPLDILPAVWFVSACSLFVGIVAAKTGFPKGDKF